MKQIFSKHSCLICSFILLGWNAVSVLVLWKTFLCCFLMEFKLLILLGYLIYQWYDFFQNNLKRQKWKHEIYFSVIILKQNSYSLGLIFFSSMLLLKRNGNRPCLIRHTCLGQACGQSLKEWVPRESLGDFHLFWEVLVCYLLLTLCCQHFYLTSVTKHGKVVSGFES